MIDRDSDYLIDGSRLLKLRTITQRLNDVRAMTFDERRDMANLIDLIISEVALYVPSTKVPDG